MINGLVRHEDETGKSAWVTIRVSGFNGQSIEYDAMIDTGFSGAVAILPEDVATLGLVISGSADTILSDGSVKVVPTYFAAIEWDGVQKLEQVIADDDVPLVGMKLLTGYSLLMHIKENGKVEITRLP